MALRTFLRLLTVNICIVFDPHQYFKLLLLQFTSQHHRPIYEGSLKKELGWSLPIDVFSESLLQTFNLIFHNFY